MLRQRGSTIRQRGSRINTPRTQQSNAYSNLETEYNKAQGDITSIYDKIIAQFAPGGGFGAGTEAMINRQKQRSISSATQNLISSGLYGTTMTAGLDKKFEEEVGTPARLKLEDLRYQAYANSLAQKAQFLGNILPSYSELANLSAASVPSQSVTINRYPGFRSL